MKYSISFFWQTHTNFIDDYHNFNKCIRKVWQLQCLNFSASVNFLNKTGQCYNTRSDVLDTSFRCVLQVNKNRNKTISDSRHRRQVRNLACFRCDFLSSIQQISVKCHKTRMWANAQRDGRPAEYRWRPLFNAANFGWRPLLDAVQ